MMVIMIGIRYNANILREDKNIGSKLCIILTQRKHAIRSIEISIIFFNVIYYVMTVLL